MADWDDEDFEPDLRPDLSASADGKPANTDKWQGEDEDDVKDSWEDAAAVEDKPEAPPSDQPMQTKKKKPLAVRLAEKEANPKVAQNDFELPEETKIEEKVRLQNLQVESDLKLAKEAFGISHNIDELDPESEEDFTQLREAIRDKVTLYKKSNHYSKFLEKLITDLVLTCDMEEMRQIGSLLTNLFHEKKRQLQEEEKKKKKKGKARIMKVRDDVSDIVGESNSHGYEDGDDFI